MAQISSSLQMSSSLLAVHDDPTKKAIARTIEGVRRLLNPQYDNMTPEEKAASAIKISAATRKHFELEVKTLQNAPKDSDKLREIMKLKQEQYEKATLADETQ